MTIYNNIDIMNSRSSSGRLLAAIAIFTILTAVCSAPVVPPPARIAGLDANSEVTNQDDGGAVPKITSAQSYFITDREGDWRILCCNSSDTNTDESKDSTCYACNAMCYLNAMDARHVSKQLRSICRCYVVAPCTHISYVIIEVSGKNYNHGPYNYKKRINESIEYGTFATSKGYQLVFMSLSLGSLVCMGFTLGTYIMHSHYRVHSRYVKHLSMSIAALIYVSAVTESLRQPTTVDFQSSGVKIPIKFSNLLNLLPGAINILINIYLSKSNKIQISSIHPELLDIYTFKMKVKYQMFKISVLLLAVDVVYFIDITMRWDFTVIHIIHLLKAAQGILVSYVLFFGPIVPVIYNKFLKCIRRERSTNEVTANPID